jgi:hypothetical protein
MITFDSMFQLLTELDMDTSLLLHRDPDQSWGYIGWFRKSDGSVIDYPEPELLSMLQSIGLLHTKEITLQNQEKAISFILTDKARRILDARKERNPTHKTPYVGEYGWLVIYEHAERKEVYPYIGETPPDLSKLVGADWKWTPYLDNFSVRCYPPDMGPNDEDLKPKIN